MKLNHRKTWLFLLFGTILVFPSLTFADGPYLNIPPTNAFDKIHSDNGTINSVNFSMPLNIKSGSGISVKSNNATHTLTISNTGVSTNQGTYNTTQANNLNINSGGFKINFINGSGATVHVENSKSGTQVNVTISATGTGGITSINSQTGPAIHLVRGAVGNITITNSTNLISINTGQNIANLATTNNQTFSGEVNFTGTSKLAPIGLGMLSSPPTNLKIGNIWLDSSTGNNMKYRSNAGTSLTLASLQANGVFTASETFNNNQTISTGQNIYMGTANVTTSAVRGFIYFSAVDGTPTGTPASHTGSIPCVYDGKTNKLWCFNGSWKSTQLS